MNEYPRELDQCPECGCEKTITSVAAAPLIERGLMKADTFLSVRRHRVILTNPVTAVLTVPALIIFYNNCFDCLLEYVTRVDLVDEPISAKIA